MYSSRAKGLTRVYFGATWPLTSREGLVPGRCWEQSRTGEQGAGQSDEVTGWAISYVPAGGTGHVARMDDSRFSTVWLIAWRCVVWQWCIFGGGPGLHIWARSATELKMVVVVLLSPSSKVSSLHFASSHDRFCPHSLHCGIQCLLFHLWAANVWGVNLLVPELFF